MRVFGIIGRPLGHSLSKAYFEEKFQESGLDDCSFHKFQLDTIGALDEVLERYGSDLRGFCVTIPYKKEIIARLDTISPDALAIGAVNCVRVTTADGKPRLAGFNTDAHGFRVGLDSLLQGERPRALVLGTGGASCAVRRVLESAGIEYRMVSRSGNGHGELAGARQPISTSRSEPDRSHNNILTLLTYEELTPEVIDTHRLIVNTTPLGTFPDVDTKPALPYDALTAGHYLYDLVYNPPVTAFLAEGAARGARTLNGETMFCAQAERNWEIWTATQ